MATADVSAENSFLLQIESVRSQLREKVHRAHQVLEERETALLAELQQLEDSYWGGVDKQIDQLKITKEHTINSLTDNKHKDILEQSVSLLDARMRELGTNLETARDRISRIDLEWDENLEGILNRIGFIRVKRTTENKGEGEPTRGLRNLGSTCYMNSILQCLSHTLPLREFYVSDEYKQFLNKRGDLSSAFKRVMLELWDSTSQHSVDPYDLRREVKARTDRFPDDRQHDAHEFMRFLLDELLKEINRASVEGRKSPADNETLGEACARHLTWEDSRISELFGGMLRSEVCCSVCSDKSIVYIPFMDISLPIPRRQDGTAVSLSDCLDMIRRKETLDEEERPYCNKCMDLTRSTKQLFMCKLPRYLVIQLKRFSYYPTRTKLTTPVKFTETGRLTDSSDKTHTYSLYGIVSQSGDVSDNHYAAYCKHNGVWKCFEDEMSSIVSWDYLRNREVHILFYVLC